MRGRDVRLLEKLADKVAAAWARGDNKGARRWASTFTRMTEEVDAASRAVRSPSHYMRQKSLPSVSTWDAIRASQDEGAFMQFLGVPIFMFEELLAVFSKHLPPRLVRRDTKDDAPRGKGRPASTFDAYDILAIALRRTQLISGKMKLLQLDFGHVDSTLGPYVQAGRVALLLSLREWAFAAICYSDADRAAKLMTALKARAGELPEGCDPGCCVIGAEGTVTDIFKVSAGSG